MDKMHAKDSVDVMLCEAAEVWYIGLRKTYIFFFKLVN